VARNLLKYKEKGQANYGGKMKINFLSKLITIATFSIAASSIASADPQVQSINGDISHKQTVYISGNSFGVKDNPQPIRYDNFESGVIGQRLPNEDNGGYYTTTTKSAYAPSYSERKVRYNGTQSAFQNFNDGNYTNYIRMTEKSLPANLKKVYVSGWFNLVTGGAPSRNTKILNMGAGTGWQTRLDVYPAGGSGHLYAYQSCSGGGSIQDWSATTEKALLDDGQWHRIEGWLDLGTPNGGDGYRDVKMDLEKIAEISGNFIDSNCSLTYVSFGHYFATDQGSPTPWAERFWDELYVDSTLSRVEIGDNINWNECTHREIQIPTQWSPSYIGINVNTGTFIEGETAYLFVVDENGNPSEGFPITIGSASSTPPMTDSFPTVVISSPTSNSSYATTSSSIDLAGTASDDFGITAISWSNDRGGSGVATDDTGNWSSFSVNDISLQEGANVITVAVTDTEGQVSTNSLAVQYTPESSPGSEITAWNSTVNLGDSSWSNSVVTYCARLLIPGSQIATSGSAIKLGFQGRSSGDYTIKSVSIAERDPNGGLGDVVDSTWTKVTFDGKGPFYSGNLSGDSWENYVVTIPQGVEKLSNAIDFDIKPGTDYYITFKIQSPSVYLDAPSGYQELIFNNTDHTQDIDWSGTGFTVIQDYHALSNIYITNDPVGTVIHPISQ
jgi:hypothetical protein